nr:hypothetical protein [Hepelivirales sp.]
MNTVTFTGSKAALLDLINYVDRSTLTVKYDASFNTNFQERCPFCHTGKFASYRNLEEHLSNKHDKTFESAAIVGRPADDDIDKDEIIARLQSLVTALRK